jgi:NADP-dependent 3-hydroxy acid dehydrogenase YdfG
VLGARREVLLKQVANAARDKALPVVADVTRRADVEHLRDVALSEFGYVDVWVNNAGWAVSKHVMELTDKEFQGIIDVVLKSVFYGMQTIAPHFQERCEGHLINISSFMGRVPLGLETCGNIKSITRSGCFELSYDLHRCALG